MKGNGKPPLIVDLDSALTLTDILVESVARLVERNPWAVFLLLGGLLAERSRFRPRISEPCGHSQRRPSAAMIDQAEPIKASIRAKVDRPFRVIERQCGPARVLRAVLKASAAQSCPWFALARLWVVPMRPDTLDGRGRLKLILQPQEPELRHPRTRITGIDARR